MSYDILLYQRAFLKRAIAEDLGDWTKADPIPEIVRTKIRQRLEGMGYAVESDRDSCCELIHANPSWGLQVDIFRGEVAFSVPYWRDADSAIQAARRDAREVAALAGLAYFDQQTGEVET